MGVVGRMWFGPDFDEVIGTAAEFSSAYKNKTGVLPEWNVAAGHATLDVFRLGIQEFLAETRFTPDFDYPNMFKGT